MRVWENAYGTWYGDMVFKRKRYLFRLSGAQAKEDAQAQLRVKRQQVRIAGGDTVDDHQEPYHRDGQGEGVLQRKEGPTDCG
jgi:hypothetical protein